jgi:hypothetical protein
MREHRHWIIIALLCAVVSLIAVFYIQSTPQYSLYKVYKAAKNHDYPTFSKYVDVDSVATGAVERYLSRAQSVIENRFGGRRWGKFGIQVGINIIRSAQPDLNDLVKRWIEDEVTSGNMMETTFKDVNLVVIFTQIKVQQEGDVADLSATIKQKPLHFKMRKMHDHWQVYDMDIDPSLVRSLAVPGRSRN